MMEVIVALFAPILVAFGVLLVGERLAWAAESVISFVWSLLE